ncbi:MAG: hypothetical protein E7158_04085 [Firmicutes bacterium]|nr:hypothetical protein [Bacillota bacterium]
MESYLNGIRVIIITDNNLDSFEKRDNVYIDKTLGIVMYNYSFGMHQDCINDFISHFGKDYICAENLADIGNVVFQVAKAGDKFMLLNHLPKSMSNRQLNGYLEIINKVKDEDLFLVRVKRAYDNNFSFTFKENFNENLYCDVVCEYLELQQKEQGTGRK